VLAELEAARERANELRRRSSKWQITLSDGMSDLIADMDHDLRDRMRMIQRDAEDSIDDGDPGPVWDQVVEWLEQRVSAAISDTFVWTEERSRWLADEVADHFADEETPLPVLRIADTGDLLDEVDLVPSLDPGAVSALQKMLIGMRGSYGGVLMIGLVTGLMGLSLINPFSLAAGVLIGGKAYRDDRESRLKRRQAEAKSLVRKQLDEVVFQVGKQLKDRLRLVQRAIRDHFTELADEKLRSLGDSAAAAQKAATVYSRDREQRVQQLRKQLAAVDALRTKAASLDVAVRQPVRA
jgi:hypothetical protein